MSFTSDLSRFCKREAPEYLDKTVRRVLIEINNRCVLRSPVGDPDFWDSPAPDGYVGGRFRANWQIGFNSEPVDEMDVYDESGRGTIAALTTEVLTATDVMGINYITNNLPYAERIENGWSSQAPHGIIKRIELEFPAIVRRAK